MTLLGSSSFSVASVFNADDGLLSFGPPGPLLPPLPPLGSLLPDTPGPPLDGEGGTYPVLEDKSSSTNNLRLGEAKSEE
ncbi:hypothetical protein WICMUC_002128 [Wickerhamomyces mucosus]|uniref:Uncharacterized protein n=1 Tax=Wickerhamomyces mucosus TaxID=1378264 RepID=A0A9P8TFA7_9ASCO|nr:hypothetical protein WICMUC_002128 [Wickerhamomyces mucosus]